MAPDVLSEPKTAGEIETVVIVGLESTTPYHFALKTSDEKGNVSGLSNCPSATTLDERFSSSRVTDLVATAVTDTSFELTWTAPENDWMTGRATAYDIRYSATPFDGEVVWAGATPFGAPPAPKPAGETETFVATGCPFAENLFFALKTVDEVGNWSALSNSAPGLALAEVFWVYPKTVALGDSLIIAFRSAGPEPVQVGLHYFLGSTPCDYYWVVTLASGSFPTGAYVLTYDFFDDSTGQYLHEDSFQTLFCQDSQLVAYEGVYFEH